LHFPEIRSAMEFEWDEEKRQEIIERRGIDIVRATLMFENVEDLVMWEDDRFNYGEKRFVAVGRIEDRFYQLVFTIRESVIRLIAVWKVSEADVEKYKARHAGRD